MFNIKLMKTAGIQGALEIFRLAKEENIPCMMGSMIEGYVGMAAAIHFAAGMNTITYNDLDVPFMWKLTDQAKKQMGFTINRNMLTLSHQAGLGITMEEGLA
jgi:L-alanine-DL-glutamate epimerase-like enolase superfamily enzyme